MFTVPEKLRGELNQRQTVFLRRGKEVTKIEERAFEKRWTKWNLVQRE